MASASPFAAAAAYALAASRGSGTDVEAQPAEAQPSKTANGRMASAFRMYAGRLLFHFAGRDIHAEVEDVLEEGRLLADRPLLELALRAASQEQRHLAGPLVDRRAHAVHLALVLAIERVGHAQDRGEPAHLAARL